MRSLALLVLGLPLVAAEVWTVRLEEPTGLYRRTNEAVAIPLDKLGGARGPFVVAGAKGEELPWQIAGNELLIPGSLIPGELPVYRISCCQPNTSTFRNPIVLRRVGMRRVELGNSRFRVMIDTGVPAIVEAYNLTAGPRRVLNLVETTPESAEALKDDIHVAEKVPERGPTGVTGENTGWTTPETGGGFTKVEFLEAGPLRALLRLSNATASWEMTWTADSAWLKWSATGGFRFAAVSALPYLPFDRFVNGSEYGWPTGPEPEEPPDHEIGPRPWKKLPGGHAVYYRREENYGALGIVALDEKLDWTGIGSRRFEAKSAGGRTQIALTFPRWQGDNTVMEARKENRILRNPLLVKVAGPEKGSLAVNPPAERELDYHVETGVSAPAAFQPPILALDGEWELAWGEKGAGPNSEWRKVRVPGSAHIQWLDPAKIYTHDADWVSYKEWWYRKRFRVPQAMSGKQLRLEFDATDYYADAFLNGHSLGRHEGYIDPYDYNVTGQVKFDAENELLVRIWTPVTYYWRHRPYYVKGSYGNVDQKPDDITALGITRSVRLVAGAAARIRDVAVNTRLVDKGAAVEVDLEAEAPGDGAQWELTLRPRNFTANESYRIRTAATADHTQLVFNLANPQLWWTWDHGKPNLYTLDVRLLDPAGAPVDGKTLAVGIREIESIGWNFYLNRKRFFVRGTNYYYNLFLSEMDRVAIERDFKLMLGMNVNTIRIHCHFTNREFYDLADENGVLIWQDFLEAWYPHDREFSLRAAKLYDPHIRYVRNHPSVMAWSTSDEEDLENYRDLTKHLAPRLFFNDPQHRLVVRSTGRYGDAHVYYGWYSGNIWQYGKLEEKFVTELGATALPNYSSLIKFMPNAWPIKDHAEDWIFHKLQIPEAMRAWGDPAGLTLEQYIPRTQDYVSRLFQLAIERMRRRKYDAGGIFHFHAIDIWPSVTMACIDFYRVPHKVYYTVQRSFQPVLASLEYDRDRWQPGEEVRVGVWAINDRWTDLPGAKVRWRIQEAGGKTVAQGEFQGSIAADSTAKLGDAAWKATHAGDYRLAAEVIDSKGLKVSENLFEFQVAAPRSGP